MRHNESRQRTGAAMHTSHTGISIRSSLPGTALVLPAVTNKGSRCWMILQSRLDTAACIDLLRPLTPGRDRKVSLMLERMQVHQAAAVQMRGGRARRIRRGRLSAEPACHSSSIQPHLACVYWPYLPITQAAPVLK